ncbi:MAG TPA: peroxiredoxin-like family protein [Solirubrobacteraceae bacterium]|nr:peroxiredoxin-like family protein [Solirubrobacteraceae bacterium]
MKRVTTPGSSPNPLRDFALKDEHGADVELAGLWRERAAAIVFLRHYLCVQCRVGAMELERDRDLLGADPNVWLIGMGTPVQAAAFKQQTGVRFPVLLSPDLRAYEAMDLPRGSLRQIFGFAAQRVARRRASGAGLERAAAGGNRPKQRPEQDWHQLGGAFVFAPGGEIVWSHRAKHAGDDADPRALGDALRRAERAPLVPT